MKSKPPESVVFLGAGGGAHIMYWHLKAAWPDTRVAVLDEFIERDTLAFGRDVLPICKDWSLAEARKTGEFRHFLLSATEPKHKKSFVEKALAHGMEPAPTLIHPTAVLDGDDIEIGPGGFVVAGATIHAAARIGDYVTVKTNAIVGHHSTIGRYCTLNPGSVAMGFVDMGEGAQLGAGTMVRGYIKIAPWVTTGMQAAVAKDLDQEGAVYVGVPAKLLPPKSERNSAD